MSFFEELQRRKVIRSVVAYLVAAFGIAQGMQLLVDALHLPRALFTGVVVLAIVLLPGVIVVSWMFDISAGGLKRAHSETSVAWRKVLLPVVAIAVFVVGATAMLTLRGNSKPLDRDLVAVLPFRVTGGSSDIAFLREGVLELLATKLTGEGGPRAVDPSAVLGAIKRINDADLEDGEPIARDLGAGQVITGSVIGNARQFTLTASLIDVAVSKKVSAEVSGSLDSLTNVIDQLAAKLLALKAGEGPQQLASLTSTSLPALRTYLDARAAYRGGYFTKAATLFRKAVDLDSTFALAGVGHVASVNWEGPDDDNLEDRTKRLVVSNMQRLGPVDRLIATALIGEDYPRPRTARQVIQAWEAVLLKAPDRADAWFMYGDRLFHNGKSAEYFDNDSLSTKAFNRALQLDSSLTPPLLHLLDRAVISGNRTEAQRLEAIRVRRDPSGAAARYQYALRTRFLGDSAGLRALRAAEDTLNFNELFILTFGPMVVSVGVDDAIGAVEKWIARSTTREEKIRAYTQARRLYLWTGMPSRAAETLRQRVAAGDEFNAYVEGALDAMFAEGDQQFGAEARAYLQRFRTNAPDKRMRGAAVCLLDLWELVNSRPVSAESDANTIRSSAPTSKDSLSANACALMIEALDADVRRNPDADTKLSALDTFLREGPGSDPALTNAANMVASRLYEKHNDVKSALRAIRRRVLLPGAFSSGAGTVREEARLFALNGDRANAVRLYQSYLSSHLRAEPAAKPQDDAARRDLARLSGER